MLGFALSSDAWGIHSRGHDPQHRLLVLLRVYVYCTAGGTTVRLQKMALAVERTKPRCVAGLRLLLG